MIPEWIAVDCLVPSTHVPSCPIDYIDSVVSHSVSYLKPTIEKVSSDSLVANTNMIVITTLAEVKTLDDE